VKYGFISDIHGNYEALTKALEILHDKNVNFIYSAGDIVGYGPNPEDCVKEIQKHAINSVMGNHDFAVNNEEEEWKFNAYARMAIQWTRDHLSLDSKNFLKSLPFFIEKDEFTVFHGTLDEEEPFNYILMPEDATISFENMKTRIGFFGHSHISGIFVENKLKMIDYIPSPSSYTFKLNQNNRYLINVGSVGQPRDGNPMGSLAIYDTELDSVEILRFQYDIDTVYKKIVSADLPRFLGERLYSGI